MIVDFVVGVTVVVIDDHDDHDDHDDDDGSGKLRHGAPVISPKSYGVGLSPEALFMRPHNFKRLNSLQIWSFRQ